MVRLKREKYEVCHHCKENPAEYLIVGHYLNYNYHIHPLEKISSVYRERDSIISYDKNKYYIEISCWLLKNIGYKYNVMAICEECHNFYKWLFK